ncbi:hypothetical protein WBP06_19410 [Novosphingobium sp. BL-8H]|uniref:hypothetical protein n=1 Tax=Novosphingobium sp. BL-8H TaxID=3127640 RepID=UPI003756DCAB
MIPFAILSLVLAAAGFHAIRRGTEKGTGTVSPVWRTGGAILLILAGVAMVAGAETVLIGGMLWLFCILPLAALPEIFGSPMRK